MPNAVRPWRMLLPLAAVLLLAGLWALYWLLAANHVKALFAEERTKLANRGVTLSCAAEGWGGFPFHFEFTCDSPALGWGDRAEVSSARLLLTALAYAPWQIVALIDGPSSFTAPGNPWTIADHQRAIAAVTFGRNWKPQLSAEIPALSVPGQGQAAKLMLHTRPSAEGGTDIAMSAIEVNYQPVGKPALRIAQGELVALFSAGKTLKIERFALEQGAVRYWGSGVIGLDASNRLAGKLDTQTNDLDGLLRILDPHLQLTDEQRSGLRTMLGLLGNDAMVPLIAQDGVLYMGPFRMADLLPLY